MAAHGHNTRNALSDRLLIAAHMAGIGLTMAMTVVLAVALAMACKCL